MDTSRAAFMIFLESHEETVETSASSFSFHLSVKAQSSNINALLAALKTAWTTARTGGWRAFVMPLGLRNAFVLDI